MSIAVTDTAPAVPFETTIEVKDRCLCLRVQRAARILAKLFDEALRPVQLTNQQFSLLMSLNRPHPPTIGPVAALLGMDRTTLTAALKPLERRGLVTVAPDEKDRRSRRLAITSEGIAVLAEAMPIWRRVHDMLDEKLVPFDPQSLRRALGLLG